MSDAVYPTYPHDHSGFAEFGCQACEMAAAEDHDTAVEAFLAASVAVWREIDRLSAEPGGYRGLDQSTDLRRIERAAWERYRAILDAE